MNLVDLVQLVITREEGKERQNFKHNAPDAPDIHFITIVAVGKQAFRSSVPASRNIFSEGRVIVEPSATAQISQFDCIP